MIDIDSFSKRLDEIFEQGIPTKAQIIDAFNKCTSIPEEYAQSSPVTKEILEESFNAGIEYDRMIHGNCIDGVCFETWYKNNIKLSSPQPDQEKVVISDPKGLLQISQIDIYAKKGYKVTVTDRSIDSGYDGDIRLAHKYLQVGKIYTIERTDVDNWHTEVWVEEIPNMSFNSVNFVPV